MSSLGNHVIARQPLGNRSATMSSLRNHNVLLTLIVRAADGLSAGIWNGATLAAYIYLIQHNSNKVPRPHVMQRCHIADVHSH
jgi:hypothetical protein